MATPDDLSPTPGSGAPEEHGLPALAPDVMEQESGDGLDDIVPTAGYGTLRVVGLGGSAGGLVALQAFFGSAPADSGAAFVVIMHLSPEHDSILAELLQRTTAMPVRQVRDRIEVEANCVYVIPPAKNLSMADGHLILSEPGDRTGKHVAVDLFFRTLADTHGPHAAAVVLSGADSDGAIGIKRIKERGGLTVAQEPTEAEHEGMPRASINTGMVDWVLPVRDIPAKLQGYWKVGSRLQLPLEDGPPLEPQPKASQPKDAEIKAERALQEVLSFLRVRTGHDFSYYKRATILRRIGRRMQVNGIEDVPAYLAFSRTHHGEPPALLQDLLISVTNFFRDRDAFAAVEEIIPSLFRGKGPQDYVRVWVAACATGEEAYSFAMMLSEYASKLEHPPILQVFATDLDESAIDTARDGAYPETIAADVSTERLRRFFNKGHGRYTIKRELREIVLFALHDLLKDSPFSRIDLISCRNLLIYLNRDAQNRALEIFHFALQPGGRLFLGSSESVDEGSPLFKIVDKKRRLYVRRPSARASLPILFGPSTLPRAALQRAAEAKNRGGGLVRPPARLAPPADQATASWSEVHYQFVEQLAPPSVIVNADFEVVHLSENAGRFLQMSGGEPTSSVIRMVHPMLRIELRAALYRAVQSGSVTETRGVPAEIEGKTRAVTLRVTPSRSAASNPLLLVVFEEQEPSSPPARPPAPAPGSDSIVQELERGLETSRAQLRETIEQADASSEELKASNEELQAINEELRSATEELEAGREELQSINEELTTVNQEMRSKVEELGRSNSDLQNLMAATQIGTVFLDRQLCIQRYTPPAVALFNLIPTDVGRPLAHLTHRLDYPHLAADAERVLEQLGAVELEVAHKDGRSFLARMLPYRTVEDHIAGVVLTFVDITARRHAEEALRASEERFRATTDSIPQIVWRADAAGTIEFFNRQWTAYAGVDREPASLATMAARFVHPDEQEATMEEFTAARKESRAFQVEHRLRSAGGQYRWFLVRAEPQRDPATGEIVHWYGTSTDIDLHKVNEEALRTAAERLRLALDVAQLGTWDWNMEADEVLWSPQHNEMYDLPRGQLQGSYELWRDRVHPDDRDAVTAELSNAIAARRDFSAEMRSLHRDGTVHWILGNGRAVYNRAGKAMRMTGIVRDITERKRADAAQMNFRQLFESAPGNYLVLEPDSFRVVAVSDAFLQVTGTEREAIMNRSVFDVFPAQPQMADISPALRASFERVTSEKRSDALAVQYYPIPNTDGVMEERWWSPVNSPIFGENGEIAYLIHRVEDVTAFILQKRAQGLEEEAMFQLEDRAKQNEADIVLRGQELQRVNEQLRKSEDKYRTLFNSIDEGFCVLEVIFSPSGEAVDYRLVETNPAFERQSGLADARGRRITELAPNLEQKWFDIYGGVVKTGQPVRLEERVDATNRWYDLYALRVGEPGENRVAAVFRDITNRRRAEENAALLASVTQDLARLTVTEEILPVVSAKIGSHLGLSVCAFMEINEAADEATVTHEWRRAGAAGVRGTYSINEYIAGEFQEASRAGKVFVVRDVVTDPRADGDKYASIDVGAFVSVPIVSDGRWHFLLVMFDSEPREWRDDEIELMRELTARLWTRLAQARNDEALRASEARLRTVFESARDFALITTDAAGAITAWNPGAEAIFRASEAEMRGRHPRELFTVEDRVAGLPERKFREAIEEGHAEFEGWMQRMDGSRFWASGLSSALRVEDNPPHGFLKIVRDMTGLHETEQARRESEDRFALVVQSIQDYAIYMLDPEGRVTTWNKGAERIKGYTAEEIIGRDTSFCSTPEDVAAGKPAQELETAAREGRWQEEIWRVRKNGERYWADELLVALRSDDGQLIAYAKFGRDLSERKRLEDERARLLTAEQAARAEAEETNQAKDRFLAVLSHELRAPLAPVQMALYALNREKRLSSRGRESLAMIVRNVESETRLIDDLLDVSRIVHGKFDLVRRPLDVHQCLGRAVEVCHADLAAKNLRLTQHLAATRTKIEGDAARLQQVFWNLLKNAAKFSPEGAEITLCSRDCPEGSGPGTICVDIIDTGIGVPPEALPKLFDAFEQGGADVTRLYGGLGLGLAISHAIVRAHGGHISGASKGPGLGATFTVTLRPP